MTYIDESKITTYIAVFRLFRILYITPDSKVNGAYMGPTWGRQDPCGPMLSTRTLLSGTLFLTCGVNINDVCDRYTNCTDNKELSTSINMMK